MKMMMGLLFACISMSGYAYELVDKKPEYYDSWLLTELMGEVDAVEIGGQMLYPLSEAKISAPGIRAGTPDCTRLGENEEGYIDYVCIGSDIFTVVGMTYINNKGKVTQYPHLHCVLDYNYEDERNLTKKSGPLYCTKDDGLLDTSKYFKIKQSEMKQWYFDDIKSFNR